MIMYNTAGETYNHNLGNGTTINYTQNKATSMTFTGMDERVFVPQYSPTGCKTASDNMLKHVGVNSQGERINVVNSDANGVATAANTNASKGIQEIDNALENGRPIEVGVDYKPKQTSNLAPKGDGMSDHIVVLSSKTESLSKQLFYQKDNCSFTGPLINEKGQLVLCNWCDTAFIVNPQTGEILDKYPTR